MQAATPELIARLREVLDREVIAGDLARAAAELALSPRTLQRRLRAAGTSFQTELTALRIARAQDLLASTDEQVRAVAQRVGCASQQHFIELFRRATGETPGRWRAIRLRDARCS